MKEGEQPAQPVDKPTFKVVKIERTYANGYNDFIEGAMLENYLENLKIADGFAVSRSYIKYKPVAWDASLSPERGEKTYSKYELVEEIRKAFEAGQDYEWNSHFGPVPNPKPNLENYLLEQNLIEKK